jgi:hypothetical protein
MDLLQEDIAVEQKKRRVANQHNKDALQSGALSGMMAKLAKIQEKAENALKDTCPPGISRTCEISIMEERDKSVPQVLQAEDPITEAITENAPKQFDVDNVSLGSEPDECKTYSQYTYVHSSANIDQCLNFTQARNVSQDLKLDTLGRDVIGSLAVCNMTRSDELSHSDNKSSALDQMSEKSVRLNKGEALAPVSEDSDSNLVTTWLLDSGASRHLTTSLDDFTEYITGNFGSMTTAEQSRTMIASAHGTVIIAHKVWDDKKEDYFLCETMIYPIDYCEGMAERLLSTNMFLVDGGHAISSFKCTTLYHKDGKPYLTTRLEKQSHLHYVLSEVVKNDGQVNMSLDGNPSYKIWHQRFAHASDLVLSHVSNNTILKGIIPPPNKNTEVCPGCALGKIHQKSFPSNSDRATSIGELIHSDLLKMPILSYHHNKYVVVILDNYSSCVLVCFIKNKSEVTDVIKHYIKLTLTQFEVKVKRIRTDNGGEYMSTTLSNFFKDRGIIHELSAPHIHQQNGRAERINRTL